MSAEQLLSRVVEVQGVRSGQPIIKGTRITVWDILGWLAVGTSEGTILMDYPELKVDDIGAALQYALSLREKAAH